MTSTDLGVDYKLYNACDMAIGLKFEEAFLPNVDRTGTDFTAFVSVLRDVDYCNLF